MRETNRREFLWAVAAAPAAMGALGCSTDASDRARFETHCAGTPTSLDARTDPYMMCRRHETKNRANRADLVLDLIERLEDEECTSFPVSEKLHALQAATRAARDDPKDEEMIVAALCHDVGGLIGEPHAKPSSMLLARFVRDELASVVAHHSIFNRRFGDQLTRSRSHRRIDEYLDYQGEPWFDLALHFTERFDRPSFDPGYDTLPLEHFEPIVRRVFS